MDVNTRSGVIRTLTIACLAACGGTPHEVAPAVATPTTPPDAAVHHLTDDPDFNRPPHPKLLAIDWPTTQLATDADALALWQKIAPTGDDWEAKLAEIPELPAAHALAAALLREGNFTCVPPATPLAPNCAPLPVDVPAPAATATLADPCLRRRLAQWAFDEIDTTDVTKLHDALRAIVAIPPPESQLVATALRKLPEADRDGELELLGIAYRAGQHEVVNGTLGSLDEAHLIEAVQKHHIPGALEVLSAEGFRAVYLAAVTDEQLEAPARVQAMTDLAATADPIAQDLRTALVAATKSPDCAVAAAAMHTLDQHDPHKLLAKHPHAQRTDAMMRAMCVLASYENLQKTDEASLLTHYLTPRGLELVQVAYDPYNEVDRDGDGDPHTERTIDLIDRDTAVLPEIEDLVRAMHHCTGTICKSDDREFRFSFKSNGREMLLWRLEVVELPPCKR